MFIIARWEATQQLFFRKISVLEKNKLELEHFTIYKLYRHWAAAYWRMTLSGKQEFKIDDYKINRMEEISY